MSRIWQTRIHPLTYRVSFLFDKLGRRANYGLFEDIALVSIIVLSLQQLVIDEYEEEIILSPHIQKAIEITEQYGEKASLEIQNSTNKFLAVLKRANELEKQILLSF